MAATLAGCSNNSGDGAGTGTPTGTEHDGATEIDSPDDDTTTAEETEGDPEVDRPANYRWDMNPARNEEIRSRLGQYVEGSVGSVVQDHPAFEFSTDREADDQAVDFEGLKLYRDATFDLMAEEGLNRIIDDDGGRPVPLEERVQAFVDEDLFTDAKTGQYFVQHDLEAPSQYDAEGWLNAETVADSLDYGHNLLVTVVDEPGKRTPDTVQNNAVAIREAYKRHHDFDVLAWGTMMGSATREGIVDPTGLLYSPDDDTLRNFNFDTFEGNGEDSLQMHAPIEEWEVLNGESRWSESPGGDQRYHPLLFHQGWAVSGQASDFGEAKGVAAGAIRSIATGPTRESLIEGEGSNYSMTTGMTEQLSRTLFEYNSNDAEFEYVWNLASVIETVNRKDGNYIFDTADQDDDYSGFFDGGFAVYEVEDDSLVNEVWQDEAGQYDNFGQVYDKVEAA
ncbi:hypothetical protein [Halorarum halobium]|uniref:hypothetical protein n=1 Tax=Halorarum halobium TaxID=3075121 RepID=UPI0028A81D50|nr:hypothetical protein [Halobaculum sp. XH14]